jgi:hypothetical protein
MRVRGTIFIAAGILVWLFLLWYGNEVGKLPSGYEFGSVVMPLPSWYRGLLLGALFSVVIGIYLLIYDFARRIIKRSND